MSISRFDYPKLGELYELKFRTNGSEKNLVVSRSFYRSGKFSVQWNDLETIRFYFQNSERTVLQNFRY